MMVSSGKRSRKHQPITSDTPATTRSTTAYDCKEPTRQDNWLIDIIFECFDTDLFENCAEGLQDAGDEIHRHRARQWRLAQTLVDGGGFGLPDTDAQRSIVSLIVQYAGLGRFFSLVAGTGFRTTYSAFWGWFTFCFDGPLEHGVVVFLSNVV